MRLNLCVGPLHRWTPAEATNEAGLRLVCKRCGKIRTADAAISWRGAQQRRADVIGRGG
jgi:hypothetical protein